MVDQIVTTGREFSNEINAEKSKVLKVSKDAESLRFTVDNSDLNNLSLFRY